MSEPDPHATNAAAVTPVGAGTLTAAGISAKAARLDEAAAKGLPIPNATVVLDGAHPSTAASAVNRRHRGPVAVRSAFAAEDNPDRSLAGHFESILGVEPDHDAVVAAIERVRESGTAEFRRDVLVMDMVDARHAGVAFTEPGWLDDLVNHTSGLGDGLLSGLEAGERLSLDRQRRAEGEPAWQSRLAGLLADVRRSFGDRPWDIEFADDGHRCWLLQIRPITGSPVRDEWFTLANHREILPDPPSVFMTSLIELAAPGLSGPLGILDAGNQGRRFIEVFDRRPYLNLSLLTDFLRSLGLPTSLVASSLGGSDGNNVPINPARLVTNIPTLVRLGLRQLTAARTATKVAATLVATDTNRQAGPAERFGPIIDEAANSYVALVDQMASLAMAMAVPVSIIGRFGALEHHLRNQRTAATQMLDDLHDLAAVVRNKPEMVKQAAAGTVPDDPRFVELWDRWLDRHGQRGRFESDLSRPRYREDPAPVLETVARLAAGPPPAMTTTSSWRAAATVPLWLFARGPMAAREALRADAMRAFSRHRADLLRCATAAVERAALPTVEDVWFLTVDELRSIDDGTAFDQAYLDERRADYKRCAAIDAPDIRKRFGHIDVDHGPDDVLRGLTLTGGSRTGVAWVLREPEDRRPAELDGVADRDIILIARSVDAGWVPLFGQVAAVAVDIGGDLSHGSIILRELGLPAITNTRRATSVLNTGDRVTLDAGGGTLRRLDPAPTP